jgi:FtsH-binding integral membrane protein
MHPFRQNAFYLLVWSAIVATLITVVLMATRSAELAAAFLIGANVALLFSVGLIAWKSQLDEERIVRIEAWRLLRPEERPAGEAGRRWALNNLEELTLRFAKASSAIAIALAGTALVVSADQ